MLGGVPVRFSDTAGLRPAQDPVEALGIARTRERLQQADLILYLIDFSQPPIPEDVAALEELADRPGLLVINKTDLPGRLDDAALAAATDWPLIPISAKTGQGLPALKAAIADAGLQGGLKVQGEMITQARHHQHLRQGLACLEQVQGLLAAYGPSPPWELVALELGAAIKELGEITGEEVGEAVLDRIFSQFCLGK